MHSKTISDYWLPNVYLNKSFKQDGPSSESSSYLNVTLRYLGPWDLRTPGLLDSWTSSFFQHLLLHPLLPPPISSSYSPPLVWFGMKGGGGWLSCDIWDWDWRWTFDLYIDVKKFRGGWWWWWWVELDYNVSSGPFLSFEIEIRDRPGPELDNRHQLW